MDLDIDMAIPRERLLSYQSCNSRESSVLSTALSVSYYKRMEYQSWSKQIKTEVASLAVLDNSEQKTSPDIQKSNNGYLIKNQCVISEALAVIRQKCGQTLGLGLGQIRYSSSIIISL